jgi:hypothetical protein
VIEGPFILKSVNVEGEITINNTTIKGQIDWSYATFKRVLNLENSIFEFETDATFTAVTVEKDIFLDEATFCGIAVFADITVMGAFYSRSTTFKKDVTFEDGIFKKKIEFGKSIFGGETDFSGVRIDGYANFIEAEFKQQASFNGAQIEGAAFFNPATFVGEADFISARIGSNAEFTGATFKQLASFNRAQIEGAAFFKPANLFSWDSVPGDDDKKLKKFLRDNFDIGWAENSEILKSDDGETISIFKYGKSAEIIIDEKKEKATLKITDGRIHKLKVKKENSKLNIYNPATFGGVADFGSARIGSTAMFTGAVFKRQASFNGAQIEGVAFFNPATFVREANFVSARIGSNAQFTEAVFKQQAIFNSAQIKGAAFFKSATFEGDADFISARIGGTADFTGAEFKQQAIFNRTQIEESAFFNPATFKGEANFVSARIGSNAVFTRATFKQQAIFNRTQIEGGALFNPATFEGEANFGSARIGSNAVFNGAEFKQQAYFNSAQIERESHFEKTIFDNDVSFQDTSLKTVFWGEPNVKLIKNIDLRGCIYDRFQPIPFWKQLMDHLGPYDRRPFTQLEETFRRAGKDKLADDVYYERKCREYTENIAIRKPYLFSWDCVPGDDDEKLKKFLRDDFDIGWAENSEILKSEDGKTISIFKDEKSAEIILDTIKKKATLKISDGRTFNLNVKKKHGKLNIYRTWGDWLHRALRKPGTWLLDRFLFYFTGYGVRLYRLLLALVPILIIGTYIFQLEGAVTPELHSAIPWSEAFWVSLNTFLPVIEIPSGADWKPSSQIIPIIPVLNIKFTTFATLLVLAGWILVPVAVAGITGLLKRPK